MADSKITALASIGTGTDPANDPLVIVDVSDVSPGGMSATGTTKKVTLNNLLACSPTATLASATITGDLTVDTSTLKVDSANNRVGVVTATPRVSLDVASGDIYSSGQITWGGSSPTANQGFLSFTGGNAVIGSTGATALLSYTNGVERYNIGSTGIATWSNVGGVAGTAMTLNSTGLGVGGSPTSKLSVFAGADGDVGFFRGGSTRQLQIGTSATAGYLNADNGSAGFELRVNGTARAYFDTSGNVGIGVTPSGKLEVQESGTGGGIGGIIASTASSGGNAGYVFRTGGTNRWSLSLTGSAGAESIRFYDINNSATRMTLDASGNLLVGTTSGGTARLDIRTSASQRIINAFSTAAGDSSTYGVYIAKFANDSTTAQRFIAFTINNDGAGSGQINANGASQAAFGTFSDSRLKENIVSLPSQLANILSLRPVEFDYKDGSGHQIGFVAQEVQEVYSDAVSEQDGFLTVTGWSKTEARLVSAIKELAAKVQALEAKLA